MQDLRAACRLDEGGGGKCSLVSEVLEREFGWPMVSGSYLSSDGGVICGDGHVWNVLPDGAWLDARFGCRRYCEIRLAAAAEVLSGTPDFGNEEGTEDRRLVATLDHRRALRRCSQIEPPFRP